MAIVFPVLIFISMGIIEFGQYFHVKHCFESALRDGARYGMQANATQAQMVSTLTTMLQQDNITYNSSWLSMADITAGSTITDVSTVPAGDLVRLQLSTTYGTLPMAVRPLNSMTGLGIGSGKTITVVCVMSKE